MLVFSIEEYFVFLSANELFPNRHRACNIFARTYFELWLQEENIGQEIMISDLTVGFSMKQGYDEKKLN